MNEISIPAGSSDLIDDKLAQILPKGSYRVLRDLFGGPGKVQFENQYESDVRRVVAKVNSSIERNSEPVEAPQGEEEE